MKAELYYEFGPYRLDPYQRILIKDGQPVPIDPQSFEVLHVLVQHAEQIIRRDDLIRAAWEVPVDNRALNFQIFHLRKALNDDSDNPILYSFSYGLPKRIMSCAAFLWAATVKITKTANY